MPEHDTSDLPNAPFDPWPTTHLHVEWGSQAAQLAADRGDTVVVVDTLTFSTTVTMAVSRGAAVLALSHAEVARLGGPDGVAQTYQVAPPALTQDGTDAKLTLSPSSVGNLISGDQVALTSINDADIVRSARHAAVLLAGCLRNRTAVARWCADALTGGVIRRVTVIAAASRWSSTLDLTDGMRPSVEDWLGAGAIAAAAEALGVSLSTEAKAAASTYAVAERDGLERWLRGSTTGREMIQKNFAPDIDEAARLDLDDTVPRLDSRGFFVTSDHP
ncbi:2-phosphosulfolactate phosphatase [Streptomyces scopuliridis]|uniref:2-phosphosulfolactate phosphatase n=1 Tax=Streptomyces scopuliridis TaxID=452529 RepID=UPI0036C1DDD8